MSAALTHLRADGGVNMVDVADKRLTPRVAVAEASVRINDLLARAVAEDSLAKGNLLETAKLAGIAAAKRTDELIPLCHSLPLDTVQVEAKLEGSRVRIRTVAKTTWKTGVEMEALTAASVAALTVIDMGKALDPAMVIERVRLIEKRGGKRDFRAPPLEEHES